jgi:methyl-accepting chemotaxis protein
MKSTLKAMLSRPALIGALPVVIALIFSGVISFSYNRLLKNYRDDVDHTFQVMSAIDNALLQLQDAETGQRGFIITGDESYLAPFETGRTKLFEVLSRLSELASDNTDQQARIESLQRLAEGKLNELEDTIITRKREGLERNDGPYLLGRRRHAVGRDEPVGRQARQRPLRRTDDDPRRRHLRRLVPRGPLCGVPDPGAATKVPRGG